MIVGEDQPDSGDLQVGETVRISYVDQGASRLTREKRVGAGVRRTRSHQSSEFRDARAYVASFGFKGPDQQKNLSGGERNRLNLALTLKMGGNLLLPTSPRMILTWKPCNRWRTRCSTSQDAVVISHDRWFLDRIATHILAWEGDDEDQAKWFWYEGTSPSTRPTRSPGSAWRRPRPHRVTHRRLTR